MAYPGQPSGQPGGQWQPGQAGQTAHQWDNMPDSDPEDDPNQTAPTTGAPTNLAGMEGYKPVQGYENVGFGEGAAAPPPPVQFPPDSEKPQEEYSATVNISEDEARDAMLKYVNEHCCYGTKAAQEMEMEDIVPSSALHYELETFTEGRSTSRDHVPYSGYEQVDGPMNGMAPPVWDIISSPVGMFQNEVRQLEVPHTAFVATCHGCGGLGFLRCYRCYGRGRLRCTSCHGSGHDWHTDAHGHRRRQSCHWCHGSGRRMCHTCGGDGRITCTSCNGYRMLKHYVKLTVRYTNHLTDYIMEKTDMPDELIRDVSGVPIFEQTLPHVWPISSYPVPEVGVNSTRIVNEHRQAYRMERQLQQRQRLRAVPVSEVRYKWKDTNTRFWVYGNEHKVHAPDYPQQCCCGCTLL